MAAFLKPHFQNPQSPKPSKSKPSPSFYSPETGTYHSTHPTISIPLFHDVVSYIFSHKKPHKNPAFIDSSSGFSLSYSKLSSLIKSVASELYNNLGLCKGDVVMLLLPNSVYFPVIFLSCLSLGVIVTPMNPLSTLLEIKKQVLDSNARLVFSVFDRLDELVTRLDGCSVVGVPDIANVEAFDGKDSIFFRKGLVFNCIVSASDCVGGDDEEEVCSRVEIRGEDVAAIMYSSGTTGRAKGVMLTHGNFVSMMEVFVRYEASLYEYRSDETVYLAVVPMFHVYGLSLFVMGLLSLGSTVVTMRKFDADEMVRAIGSYGVTHLHCVPPLLAALTRKAKEVGDCGGSFRSLRQVSCGAAPLSEKCINDFIETLPHVDFIQGYGMTESTAIGTRGYNVAKAHKYSSVGLLSPNVEAKVVDWVKGSFLPPGSIGELWLRTPGNMKGYLNNAEATMETIDQDGWLHTGDIVYFDQEGYLYVVDRLKEMIKYKGFQIAPADLEAVLVSHPDVLDAAVTGARDEQAGEIPVAFVVLKGGSSVSQADLIDYVAKQVAPYKKVRKLYFRSSIPRSAAGKILRRELRSLLVSKL